MNAQTFYSIHTRWSDDFSSWEIEFEKEQLEGELQLRWPAQDNWTAWHYRVGELSGQIKLKWSNNFNEWEVRGNNEIVTARAVWPNNYRAWRINDGRNTFTLKTKYGNRFDEWELEPTELGNFSMTTVWKNDPRDWEIYDELPDSVAPTVKMAMVFLTIFHSIPR